MSFSVGLLSGNSVLNKIGEKTSAFRAERFKDSLLKARDVSRSLLPEAGSVIEASSLQEISGQLELRSLLTLREDLARLVDLNESVLPEAGSVIEVSSLEEISEQLDLRRLLKLKDDVLESGLIDLDGDGNITQTELDAFLNPGGVAENASTDGIADTREIDWPGDTVSDEVITPDTPFEPEQAPKKKKKGGFFRNIARFGGLGLLGLGLTRTKAGKNITQKIGGFLKRLFGKK